MKMIYVVTCGSYSSYGIEAIFSTRKLAQAFIDGIMNPYDTMRIEEWELDPHIKDLKKGRKAYRVTISKEGEVGEVSNENSTYILNKVEHGFPPGISFQDNKKVMNCSCWANDEKHAIKIANEKRIQFIALNKWPQ